MLYFVSIHDYNVVIQSYLGDLIMNYRVQKYIDHINAYILGGVRGTNHVMIELVEVNE